MVAGTPCKPPGPVELLGGVRAPVRTLSSLSAHLITQVPEGTVWACGPERARVREEQTRLWPKNRKY